jgi:hypothetical protein
MGWIMQARRATADREEPGYYIGLSLFNGKECFTDCD